jgi:hypothetical protein
MDLRETRGLYIRIYRAATTIYVISTEVIYEVRLFPEETDFASVNTINFTDLWNEDSDVLLDARSDF